MCHFCATMKAVLRSKSWTDGVDVDSENPQCEGKWEINSQWVKIIAESYSCSPTLALVEHGKSSDLANGSAGSSWFPGLSAHKLAGFPAQPRQ